MRSKGKLNQWNDDKAFGFITPNDGGQKVFIHIKSFNNRRQRPKLNQVVTYTLSTDNQGRLCATKASHPGERLTKKRAAKQSNFAIVIAVLFIVTVTLLARLNYVPLIILIGYIGLSVVTFIAYAIDKSRAQQGLWRTPENTLQTLAFLGGWPGALIAQQKLRHKSKKVSFRVVLGATVVMNLSAFAWLFSPSGSELLTVLNNII